MRESSIPSYIGLGHEISDKRQFTNHKLKLVSEWNLDAIRKEEIENSNMIFSRHAFTTRIIFNGKKYNIECVDLKDFFNLQRDGMDFRE